MANRTFHLPIDPGLLIAAGLLVAGLLFATLFSGHHETVSLPAQTIVPDTPAPVEAAGQDAAPISNQNADATTTPSAAAGDEQDAAGSAPAADLADAGRRMCLSLRVLQERAQRNPRDREVSRMAAIGYLESYVVDPDHHDIILIGRVNGKRPSLHLDDLAVDARNIWNGNTYAYCSLNPQPEDVLKVNHLFAKSGRMQSEAQMRQLLARLKKTWGAQTTEVGGVPRESRDAHVMIDADYHMKMLSQGLETIEGIPSCLDLSLAESVAAVDKGGAMPGQALCSSRLWFHIAPNEPTYMTAEGIVGLDQCSVIVLTEQQRALADGSLQDTGSEDPIALKFAEALSSQFNRAAAVTAPYADLENLYRLDALLQAMQAYHAVSDSGLDLSYLLNSYQCTEDAEMPPALHGLANGKGSQLTRGEYQYTFFPLVFGGVSRDMPFDPSEVNDRDNAALARLRKAALAARPSAEALSWPL
jgi:hypothetical protein